MFTPSLHRCTGIVGKLGRHCFTLKYYLKGLKPVFTALAIFEI